MTTTPKTSPPRTDERGFVLILVLVTLLLLTVLGIWASRSAQIELRTAANERIQRDTFYQADAGTHLAERLIYHAELCVPVDENDGSTTCLNTGSLPESLQVSKSEACFTESENLKVIRRDDATVSTDEGQHTFIYYPNLPKPELYEPGQDDHGNPVYVYRRTGNVLPHTIVRIGGKKTTMPGCSSLQHEKYNFPMDPCQKGVYTILSQHRSQFTKTEPGSEAQVNVLWQKSGIDRGKVERAKHCKYQ